jgi:Na+/melibiose symporter-like transporter
MFGVFESHRMGLIILIVVIPLLVGAFPTGDYGFGYRSHGIIVTILVILFDSVFARSSVKCAM